MNVSKTEVTQAANLSFFMVNLSYYSIYLLNKGNPSHKPKTLLDLAICRGTQMLNVIKKIEKTTVN